MKAQPRYTSLGIENDELMAESFYLMEIASKGQSNLGTLHRFKRK
jgi:hypothetical protein